MTKIPKYIGANVLPVGFYNSVLHDIGQELLSYYPTNEDYFRLKRQLAEYTGLKAENVLLENGADGVIKAIYNFLAPEKEIIICPPCFKMFSQYAGTKNSLVEIPRLNGIDLDIEQIKTYIESNLDSIGLLIFATPENPTGAITSRETIINLLKTGIFIVVDEVYFEYTIGENNPQGLTVSDLISKYPNLLIIRSFSKWAGLPGIRLGYLLASPQIIEKLETNLPIYNVNRLSLYFGEYALTNRETILAYLSKLLAERETIVSKFSLFSDIKVYSGYGAYITINSKSSRGEELFNFLKNSLKESQISMVYLPQTGLESPIRFGLSELNKFEPILTLINQFYYK